MKLKAGTLYSDKDSDHLFMFIEQRKSEEQIVEFYTFYNIHEAIYERYWTEQQVRRYLSICCSV